MTTASASCLKPFIQSTERNDLCGEGAAAQSVNARQRHSTHFVEAKLLCQVITLSLQLLDCRILPSDQILQGIITVQGKIITSNMSKTVSQGPLLISQAPIYMTTWN